jgi:hypothetical protein
MLSLGHGIALSVSETVSFVSGKKATPRNQNVSIKEFRSNRFISSATFLKSGFTSNVTKIGLE